jgi:hypothetical protein
VQVLVGVSDARTVSAFMGHITKLHLLGKGIGLANKM